MKKLMIAACAIALAGAVQAGQCKWQDSSGLAAVGCSDKTKGYSGTIYLMDGAVAAGVTTPAAETFFKAWVEAGATQAAFDSLTSGALNYATLTTTSSWDAEEGNYQTGKLSSPKVGSGTSNILFGEYPNGTILSLYQVAYDADAKALYISETINSKSIPGTGSGAASFNNAAAAAGTTWKIDGGYQGAGWYTAVPEPTSGLLLLLGVAGLALRRRRA